jgi:type IV secretory pathway TrbF-like protein
MEMFSATIDAKEVDLINAVAKVIHPMAFYYGEYRGSAAEQACAKTCDEHNRQRARDMAVEIIAVVRASSSTSATADSPKGASTP